MRGVLVNKDQAVGCLGNDVGCRDLSARDAEGVVGDGGGGWFGAGEGAVVVSGVAHLAPLPFRGGVGVETVRDCPA